MQIKPQKSPKKPIEQILVDEVRRILDKLQDMARQHKKDGIGGTINLLENLVKTVMPMLSLEQKKALAMSIGETNRTLSNFSIRGITIPSIKPSHEMVLSAISNLMHLLEAKLHVKKEEEARVVEIIIKIYCQALCDGNIPSKDHKSVSSSARELLRQLKASVEDHAPIAVRHLLMVVGLEEEKGETIQPQIYVPT